MRVLAIGLASIPTSPSCGALEHDPENRTTITNPTVIVEDLSPSTEILLGVRRCEGDAGSVSFAPSERVRGHSMRCCIYLSGKGMGPD